MRYYNYNLFPFQELRREFKIQCRNLSLSNVEKPLQSRVGNNWIYTRKGLINARKKDIKCTTITSKRVIIPVTREFIVLRNILSNIIWSICGSQRKLVLKYACKWSNIFVSHRNVKKDRHKKR